MIEETGGFAFPSKKVNHIGTVTNPSMTLRDWFAGEAPEAPEWWMNEGCPQPPPGWSDGYGATKWEELTTEWRVNRIAIWRWKYADAMIATRKCGDE